MKVTKSNMLHTLSMYQSDHRYGTEGCRVIQTPQQHQESWKCHCSEAHWYYIWWQVL